MTSCMDVDLFCPQYDTCERYDYRLCIVTYSNYYPSLCSSRPHNDHQLPAQLLLWAGHREEKLPRLHRPDESRHAGPAGMRALTHDGR